MVSVYNRFSASSILYICRTQSGLRIFARNFYRHALKYLQPTRAGKKKRLSYGKHVTGVGNFEDP